MAKDNFLNLTEVAMILGVSVYTINNWYRFKKQNPDNDFAKMLPEPRQLTPHSIRLWKESDIKKFVKFQESIPRGRNGIMGDTTQPGRRRVKR